MSAPDRPALPPEPPRRAGLVGIGVGGLLALATAWTLHRELTDGALIGGAGTDALRGLWTLDHLRRSLIPPDTPLLSRQVNLPAGAWTLVLPWASGVLAAPLGALLSPIAAYNLFLAGLLWAWAWAAAGLARAVSGSWAAGLAVGLAMLGQPMILHALADGTPEHAALWALPASLALGLRALERGAAGAAVGAALLAIVLALDSPYAAIYGLICGAIVVGPPLLRRREARGETATGWAVGLFVVVAALGALGLAAVYAQLPLGTGGGSTARELQAINCADPARWRQLAQGLTAAPPGQRPPPPAAIPTGWMLAALGAGALGGRRALPWLGAGLLSVGLAFGRNPSLPADLQPLGLPLGAALLWINSWLYDLPLLDHLRFPSRWLGPGALLLGVAGAIGLARGLRLLPWRVSRAALGIGVGLWGLQAAIEASGYDQGLPTQPAPQVAFAAWLRDQPEAGGVLLLPVVRAAPPGLGRNDRPVFGGLDTALAGADLEALQVLHGRPQVGAPGLQTLAPRPQDPRIARLLRDWDDLARPRLTGDPLPPGADDPRADRVRREALALLIAGGLRWVVIDQSAYEAVGLTALRRQIGASLAEEHTFSEGAGVLIWTLSTDGG